MTSILQNAFTSTDTFLPFSPYYTTATIPCPSYLPPPQNTCNCTATNLLPDTPTTCKKVHYLTVAWPEEGTCLVALLLIGAALYMLQDFIKEYAFSLVERQGPVQQLRRANDELRSQLKA